MNTFADKLLNRHQPSMEKVMPRTRLRFEPSNSMNIGLIANPQDQLNTFDVEEIEEDNLTKNDGHVNHVNVQNKEFTVNNTSKIINQYFSDKTQKDILISPTKAKQKNTEALFQEITQEKILSDRYIDLGSSDNKNKDYKNTSSKNQLSSNSNTDQIEERKTNSQLSIEQKQLNKEKSPFYIKPNLQHKNEKSTSIANTPLDEKGRNQKIVNIRIGRIEVKATPKQKISHPKTKRRIAKPNMSLDDYLKKQK
ncbi:MAG: hypothetical protein AAFP82_18730 [Bacteroidota bacterium]